jgi:KUP system potassium uptake protein
MLYKKLYPQARSLEKFLVGLSTASPPRVPGTAVYMAAPGEGVPHALVHNLWHNQVLHERVIILTILVEDVPRVDRGERYIAQPRAEFLPDCTFWFYGIPGRTEAAGGVPATWTKI